MNSDVAVPHPSGASSVAPHVEDVDVHAHGGRNKKDSSLLDFLLSSKKTAGIALAVLIGVALALEWLGPALIRAR